MRQPDPETCATVAKTDPTPSPYSSPYPPTDLHAMKAAQIFQIPLDQVTPEQRQAGKRANYVAFYSTSCPCMNTRIDPLGPARIR